MEKTKENKFKDYMRHAGEEFVRLPQTFERRRVASGVTFGGEYVKRNNRKTKNKRPT